MRRSLAANLWFQRRPSVRLRREAWGGIAFDRVTGDRLELDAEGFAVLAALGASQTLRTLREILGRQAHRVRMPELATFVHRLEQCGLVVSTATALPSLDADPWAEPIPETSDAGLRAPLVAHWAVTYHCNLHCPCCYSDSRPERPLGVSPEARLRLVERIADWGVLEVALGGGEPSLLPDFPELLAAIRTVGMVPNVTTNGTVNRPSVIEAIAKHAGTVHLSADRPELLDTDRGEGVFRRLARTAGLLRQAGVRLGVNLLLTPHNVREIHRSLEALVDLGVGEATFVRPKGRWVAAHWPGFPQDDDLRILMQDLKAYLAQRPPLKLYVDTSLRGPWASMGLLDDPEPEVLGCGGAQRHVAVTPEGDVYPCSHARRPEFRLGNLLTDEFDALWSTGAGRLARHRYREACQGVTCPCSGSKGVGPTGRTPMGLDQQDR